MKSYCYEYPHPAVTTDIVVFTVRDDKLKLLLIARGGDPYKGKWALPGGFVGIEEGLEEAARRELQEETGLKGIFLEQLYTFGNPSRDPRERIISVAYYALIPSEKLELRADSDADAVGWFDIDKLPFLAFDHEEIVKVAHARLVAKLDYSTISFQFLPKTFTLAELQNIYEIILRQEVDKRNFRKWAMALEQIEETGEEVVRGAHRPARLYRLKSPKKVIFTK